MAFSLSEAAKKYLMENKEEEMDGWTDACMYVRIDVCPFTPVPF